MKWNIFKPRRAIRESVKEGSKKNVVLEDGELMVVRKSADSSVVKGVKTDIYIGNGVTTMEEMKPALYGDTSEEPITVTPDTSEDSSTALNKVTSGKPLSELVGSLKRAVELGGGGSGEFNDIISLDSVDYIDPEHDSYNSLITIYQDEDQEMGYEAEDHTPKKDSYPSNFIVDIYQESETSPTSETFIPFCPDVDTAFMYGYYNNDNNIISIPIPTYYSPSFMYNKLCPYNNQYYKFYYYHNDCEIWTNYPLLYTGDSENNGVFIYYEDYELKDHAEANLSTDDFVQYFNGVYSQYHYRAYDFDENTITNFILIDPNNLEYDQGQLTSPYESEIIAFLEDQMNLAFYNYSGMTYGMIFDFKNSIVYEKYLVIPQWFGLSNDMRFNSSIESCITHPDTTPSIGDFVVYKYKDPTTINLTNYAGQKICKQIGATITIWDDSTSTMVPYYIKDQISIMHNIILPNGSEVPAGSIGIIGINSYEYSYDGTYKIKMHIEYSDNSLVYQEDSITSTEIYDALGYHPIPSEGFEENLTEFLGSRTKCNEIITYNSSGYIDHGCRITSYYDQYLFDINIKLFPVFNGEAYGYYRDSYAKYINLYPLAQLLGHYDMVASTIECPYNNKKYRYTYYLRNDYYVHDSYEIYSNYVLVAVKDSQQQNTDYIYYLNPGQSSSGDTLVQLTEFPVSDDNFYCEKIDTMDNSKSRYTGNATTLNTWPTWSPNGSPYYYGTNLLLFDNTTSAKTYASYYYEHFIALPYERSNYTSLESFCYGKIDVKNHLFYPLDFMQSYNGMDFEHSDAIEPTYWYQAESSNDPDSPYYSINATPHVGYPIMFTRTYETPRKLNYNNYGEYDPLYSEKDFMIAAGLTYTIGISCYPLAGYQSNNRDMKNFISFYYNTGRYPSLAETTDIRKEIFDLKDMIVSSLNGSY